MIASASSLAASAPASFAGLAGDAETLLARLAQAARRAVASLDEEQESAFAEAVDECEALRAALDPLLAGLAARGVRVAAPALARVRARAEEAAEAHARLTSRVARQRDRIAEALQQLERPDHVARAYGAVGGGPQLSFVR